MGRCVIVGGADIENYVFVRGYIDDGDYVIYCDCGLTHMDRLGVKPSLIVGDFDSHDNPHMQVETIVLPTVKDDTDTVYAVKEAIKRGYTEFVLIGAVGRRMDHTLGNLAILMMLDSGGFSGVLVDDYSEISIISSGDKKDPVYVRDNCKYFSLLAAGGDACGVTVKNAKYNVDGADLTSDFPLGVSNEVPEGMTAEVTVDKGRLFLIKVFSE